MLHLLQLEPGEGTPLRLALLGLPALVLLGAISLVLALSLRRRNSAPDVRRARLAAAALGLVGVAVLAAAPAYRGALGELVRLPWRALTG